MSDDLDQEYYRSLVPSAANVGVGGGKTMMMNVPCSRPTQGVVSYWGEEEHEHALDCCSIAVLPPLGPMKAALGDF